VPAAEPPREGGSAAPPGDDLARGYARGRARADAIRAQLQPLGPDERPLGLKLAVGLALVIAAANLIAAAAGAADASPLLGVGFALVMCALAAGLWQRRYYVILLFQALLAVTLIVAAISLVFARNLAAVAFCLAAIAACAPVFWLLVRVMARLQVPRG
jgi:hypothetical protein